MRLLRNSLAVLAFLAFANGGYIPSRNRRSVDSKADCNLSKEILDNIASYKNDTELIIDYFTNGPLKGVAYKQLALLVDKYPQRISGSKILEDAIDYMVKLSMENAMQNVRTENVKVPRWLRAEESAKMIKPIERPLTILGLGKSVSTPQGGITARVVVVQSFEELRELSNASVTGNIVLYDEPFIRYGETVSYRSDGAVEAAKKGAVAALVRSVTPFSLSTPHTGNQDYADGITQIPVAAITHEEADMMKRLQDRGEEVVVSINMTSTLSNSWSRNMITELVGSELPGKVVLVSGHLDSWDVGDGAMDDGAGCIISWIAPLAMKMMNLRPSRTVRAVLWTAEEVGLVGSTEYEKANRYKDNELSFVMESDFGTFMPLGLEYEGSEEGECMMQEILKHFSSINATQLSLASPGPDLGGFLDRGIPGGGLLNDNEKYFWYHHSHADTLNVIDPDVLDLDAAFWTAFSYIVADMEFEVPRKS